MSIIHLTENLTKQIPDEIEERDSSTSWAAEPIVALPVHVGSSWVDPDDDVYHDGDDDDESDYDGDLRSHGGPSRVNADKLSFIFCSVYKDSLKNENDWGSKK